jgi:hypothetical protein
MLPEARALDTAAYAREKATQAGAARGDGRTYTITLTATDGHGNNSTAACSVVVPKSKK